MYIAKNKKNVVFIEKGFKEEDLYEESNNCRKTFCG